LISFFTSLTVRQNFMFYPLKKVTFYIQQFSNLRSTVLSPVQYSE
jgi:hypothetical protein